MKSFLLMILAILVLGCFKTTHKDSNTNSSLPEKTEVTFTSGKNVGDKPPKEYKLSSILYELAIAKEPEKFANEHNIFLAKDKVKVSIYFNPASSNIEREHLIENYKLIVEKKSNDILRALVSIDRLIPLSKEIVVWSISLPDRTQKS